MHPPSDQYGELEALEALIVAQLRNCGSEVDVQNLPRLTNSEVEAMDSFDDDFVSSLLRGDLAQSTAGELDCDEQDFVCVGDAELSYGLNRADGFDAISDEEIRKRRKEVLDQLQRRKGTENDRPSDDGEQRGPPGA